MLVDAARCEGHGMCEKVARVVFELDDESSAQLGLELLHGDLGYSIAVLSRCGILLPVDSPSRHRSPPARPSSGSLIGVGAGVLAAIRPRTIADRVVTFFALFFYSMPTFLLGLLLLYFAFYKLYTAGLHLFPGGGYVDFTQDPLGWADHLILPWSTLAW